MSVNDNGGRLLEEALAVVSQDLRTYPRQELDPHIMEENGELFVSLWDEMFVGGEQPLEASYVDIR